MSKNLVLLLVMSIAGCGSASADLLEVSVSGQFSSSDTNGPLVAPIGIFNLGFVVDSNPTPLSSDSLAFDVPVTDFSYTLNMVAVSVTPTVIEFDTFANGGLFDVKFGSLPGAPEFDFQGAQAFSGTTAAPVFAPGSYSVSSWLYSDASNYDMEFPPSLDAQITPVPEPSSSIPILGALLALIAVRFRKFGWAR